MLKYRFTPIKHIFLRSEELATKNGRWETFQTPHNGSYNKHQFSADPDTHVFECEKNLRPSAAKCVQILGTKNASGQMSLLNTNAGLAEILRTGFSPRPVIAALPQNAFPKDSCRRPPHSRGAPHASEAGVWPKFAGSILPSRKSQNLLPEQNGICHIYIRDTRKSCSIL